jgi:hypothetical protein
LIFNSSVGCIVGWQRRLSMEVTLDHTLAIEAKAMVALAFRNGPIEAVHAGSPCAACCGNPAVSHISDEEMKAIMKSAIDTLYQLFWQRENDPAAYLEVLAFGERNTINWDDPELEKPRRRGISTESQNP